MKPKRIDGAIIMVVAFLGVLLYSCGCASFNKTQSHILAFERPNINCIDLGKIDIVGPIHEWDCPAPKHAAKNKLPYGCPKGQHIEVVKEPPDSPLYELILVCKPDSKP